MNEVLSTELIDKVLDEVEVTAPEVAAVLEAVARGLGQHPDGGLVAQRLRQLASDFNNHE